MPVRTTHTEADRLFSALANPTRRDLLDALRGGARGAGELASMFDMARPSVVEHLRGLLDAGLVSEHREGRRNVYDLCPEPLQAVAVWLHPYERFWHDRLGALRSALDEMDE